MKMIRFAAVFAAAMALSGCATARKALDGTARVIKVAKPEYAATVEQIRKALAGDGAVKLEGFTFSRTFFYEGRVVADPAMITWEDKWTKTTSAHESTPPARADLYSATDADLIRDINAILDAAGVEK